VAHCQVEEHNAVRLRLMAEMADSSNLVKTLVIKAEDARILSNMALTRKMYQQLYGVNRDLIMEHTKRATNHTDLLAALKEVRRVPQRASMERCVIQRTGFALAVCVGTPPHVILSRAALSLGSLDHTHSPPRDG
jgi:hypothetical protein